MHLRYFSNKLGYSLKKYNNTFYIFCKYNRTQNVAVGYKKNEYFGIDYTFFIKNHPSGIKITR